jgi:SAM-dependent methyltransferase
MLRCELRTSEPSVTEVAAVANRTAYDSPGAAGEIEGSPHIRHASVRSLFERLASEVVERSRADTDVPHILDIGAGDGTLSRTFLELGARVTAVDVSERQLAELAARNADFGDRVTIVRGDVLGVLERFRQDGARFDVVSAVSFLHHVPNYFAVVDAAVAVLEPHGQLFAFQDPMRTTSMRRRDRRFSRVAYVSWRVRQEDVGGGFRRYLRRRRGVWLDDCPADNVEYHELRAGLDQDAIRDRLVGLAFDTRVVLYFATQSPLWQTIGAALGVRNKFAVVAARTPAAEP